MCVFTASTVCVFTASNVCVFTASTVCVFTASTVCVLTASTVCVFTASTVCVFTASTVCVFTASTVCVFTASTVCVFTASTVCFSCDLMLYHVYCLSNVCQVTGIQGLMGRSVVHVNSTVCGGVWHNSSTQPEWKWKGDTSSDEVRMGVLCCVLCRVWCMRVLTCTLKFLWDRTFASFTDLML